MVTRDILETAIFAPSGDNVQPWKFKLADRSIDIFDVPEADTSFYNFNQSASYIAHGTLIENIVILASGLGYEANIKIFPESNNKNLVAHIELNQSQFPNAAEKELSNCIRLRATNRNLYREKEPLTEDQINLMREAAKKANSRGKLIFITDPTTLKALTSASSNNERLVFSNQMLHDFFYSHLIWQEDEIGTKVGFDAKTLELPPPGVAAFKFFKKWSRVSFLNHFGLSNIVAGQAKKLHASAPAMGAITIHAATPELYIETGRVAQRVWLEATRLGLALQPLTGILFFSQRIKANSAKELTPAQIKITMDSYKVFENVFEAAPADVISFMFRIGNANAPSARTTRRSLDSLLLSS